uniref:Uncharacterized protein n=1 Tax=Anguilla anguilla TaxID=7936 RepID=A0A0E9SLD7_ANGAN
MKKGISTSITWMNKDQKKMMVNKYNMSVKMRE